MGCITHFANQSVKHEIRKERTTLEMASLSACGIMPKRSRIRPKTPQPLYLRLWLDHVGMSQDDLGAELGAAKSTVSGWVNGSRGLSVNVQTAIAEALGIQVIDLYRRPSEQSLDTLLDGMSDADRDDVIAYARFRKMQSEQR